MTASLIKYSMFQEVLFPKEEDRKQQSGDKDDFSLRRSVCYRAHPDLDFRSTPLVVFDLETTGLDSQYDRIIEVGAQKLVNFQVVDEFSSFVRIDTELSSTVTRITGITDEMLKGQPAIQQVIPDFLKFIDGSILMAHNAGFDKAFLKEEANRLGLDLEWSVFCSLKLARKFLADLESKSLDSLAEHYGLTFEARHRSIGDVKVTVAVIEQLFKNEAMKLHTWGDLTDFYV